MSDSGFPDLRAFLDQLRRDGELRVVDAEVDARLEAAEIHRRVIAAGGPALLFSRVRNAELPLVTNLFGTARRAELAFGRRPGRLIRRVVELAETLLPPTAGKLWGARDAITDLMRIGLRSRASGPVTEVVTKDVRLDRLPVLTCWAEDGGPFFTLPLVYTEHPGAGGSGRSNLAIYRLQVHDARSTGMHWQIGKGGGFHYAAAEARGESLPVTVFLGGPPALMLAAIAPLPENVPELMLASLIAGRKLARCPGPGPHPLVADAEIALVGHVPPRLRQPGRAVRRPLRLLLAAPRLPGVPGRGALPPQGRDLPRDGRRQAAPGGLLHRRPAAGAALAALPARDARRRRPLVVRRDRLSLARGRGRARALQARGDGLGVPHPRRGPALAHQVPAADRPPRGPARLPRHARAPARAHAPRDRPLRLLEPLDGHARLHRPDRERRLEGRLARARRSGARAAARVPAGGAAASRGHGRERLLRRLPRRRRTERRGRSRARPRGSPPTRHSPAGRSWC